MHIVANKFTPETRSVF